MTPRVEQALLEGIAALEQVGLRYAVVGGLAVGVWGVPRATRDVDVYAELPLDARANLETALLSRGFDVPAMAAELQRFGVFRSKLRRERVFLDIFDATGPLGDAILQRRDEGCDWQTRDLVRIRRGSGRAQGILGLTARPGRPGDAADRA